MVVIAALVLVLASRRRTERALIRSQRQLQGVLDAATQASIIVTDVHGLIRIFNSGAELMLGYSAQELVGLQTPTLIHDAEELRARSAELSAEYGRPINGFESFAVKAREQGSEEREWTYCRKNGERRRVHLAVTAIRDERAAVSGFFGVAVDITDRKKFEQELRESQRMLRDVINTIPVRVFWKDRDGLYLGCNNLFAHDAGRAGPDDLVGKGDEQMTWSPEAAKYRSDDREVLESGCAKIDYEESQVAPDGSTVWLRGSKVPLRTTEGEVYGVLGTYMDVTERKQLDEQLRQSQKMDAIGQLAGGIAHDFNNMLGGIFGAAELLDAHIPDDPSARQYHNMIMISAERAADLTSQLLAFARRQPASSTAVDVHEVIEETATLLAKTIDRRIVIDQQLEAKHSHVIGDPSLLHSALLNLGINASHAMPEGGRLTLATRQVTIDAALCEVSSFDLTPGPFLEVEIRDSGEGIDEAVLPRIFEPFFTTKTQGKGTGLGLAAVYGTVQQHFGMISVYSEPGAGTCFHILLPLAPDQLKEDESDGQLCPGSGRVLVVDDEEVMRLTAKAILESLGYEVILAENGVEGLSRFKQDPDHFDLVVLDMVMPEMNGRDCFRAIRSIRPEQRVLLSSGFTREDDLAEMKREGLLGFIRKPYHGQVLGQAVHDALQG
ncbi:MAG: PAS domain S-box protein [Planctomycetota bacterium]|jgi:PAS domain S-box-containing protein|nr:PAS domain S-box protein [Planctomycetota bacterium]